ncbi:ABC transporter substrate-binding protein [Longispora fulva]|uniref:Peptide/nickel transport system substrate-binding protein n=1 Tax=Longispora fulva TaxID=619741 RepID=A0A8J7KVA7_9ACTN|nr:ABC transporter substrate-binding protein [Longispora fulva]MBG6135077.1 peptide/nickel transport system substrate-binding protein [Longispora fulva]
MRRATMVAGVALALGLSACSSGNNTTTKTGTAVFNAADSKIVNASDHKGGTLNLAISDDWDSIDPGNTYYAFSWDFARLYGRSLTMFKPAAGKAGLELVPDLATGLGQVSDGGKTITYKLKPGVKYEDGTPVKAADVKYAVARTYARDVLPNGPTYFVDFLDAGDYKGPYKTPDMNAFTGIQTPDDSTVVFKLKSPFGDFDFLVSSPQTVPVPQAKDTGAKYQEHPLSTGSYKVDSYEPGKQFLLSKNPNWDTGDPNRKQLVDKIDVKLKTTAEDIDNRLLAGSLDADVAGSGVQAAAQSKILSDPKLKANSDNTFTGRLWFFVMDEKVAPFDNIECRRAVQYATDKVSLQTAYGGPIAGGDIATTMLPPTIVGYQKFDLFATPDSKGDVAKAKDALAKCGKPDGFSTTILLRADRPKEVASGEALQQALSKVGIKTEIKSVPAGQYFTRFAGAPEYVKTNNIGIVFHGWSADWPTGFGFLQQLVDGRTIKPQGNTNVQEMDDPAINALFDKAAASTDAKEREAIYGQIDKAAMEHASLVPFLYGKGLLYRNPAMTNVVIDYSYGMYNYTQLGKQ